jgi:hypothetical protein
MSVGAIKASAAQAKLKVIITVVGDKACSLKDVMINSQQKVNYKTL